MAGDKARKRRKTVYCDPCKWRGSRRNGDALRNPCPKCGRDVRISTRGIGRPPKPGGAHPVRPIVIPDALSIPERYRTRSNITIPLIEAIERRIAQSQVSPVTAALAEGVPERTWQNWLKQGAEDQTRGEDSIFAATLAIATKGRAEAECVLAKRGQDLAIAGTRTWQAPYRHLESLVPERWMKESKIALNAQVLVASVDLPPAPAADLSEYLTRAVAIDAVHPALAPSHIDRNETEGAIDRPIRQPEDEARQQIATEDDSGDGWGDGGR